MVYGELESVFEVAEKLSKLSRARVEREAFCPENGTFREVILHVFHEFIAIAQSWVSQDMRRYGNSDERGSCGDELRSDSWRNEIYWYQLLLLGGSWFGRCWSARLWWCLNNASSEARWVRVSLGARQGRGWGRV